VCTKDFRQPFSICFNGLEENRTRVVQTLCGLIIADCPGLRIKLLERTGGLKILLIQGQRLELLVGSHHHFVGIALALAAFGIGDGFGEQAWSVEIEIGIEVVAAEGIYRCGEALRDVAVAQRFAYDY